MKEFKYLSVVIISLAMTLVFSSCFADISEIFESEPTTQETTQKPTEPKPIEPKDTGYNYDALKDPALQKLYGMIHENVNYKIPIDEFNIEKSIPEKDIRLTLNSYMYDHPEVFWLDTTFSYFNHSKGTTSIWLTYTMDIMDVEDARARFDKELEKALSKAPKNTSAYELEKFAYDYIIDNCEYDHTAAEAQEELVNEDNAYGVFVDKEAVCSGYARAFQLLCKELGVDCVSIFGESEGEGHQWNCVKLDEDWYQVDVTWGDGENGELCRYDFFNLTDEQMYTDHTSWKLFSEVEDVNDDSYNHFIPKCTSDKYNYFKYSCVTITDIYNSDEIVDYIANSAKEGKKYAEFLIDDNLDYSDTLNALLYDGYLYEWIEDANDKNDYSPEIDPMCQVYKKEDINVITVELLYIGEG